VLPSLRRLLLSRERGVRGTLSNLATELRNLRFGTLLRIGQAFAISRSKQAPEVHRFVGFDEIVDLPLISGAETRSI